MDQNCGDTGIESEPEKENPVPQGGAKKSSEASDMTAKKSHYGVCMTRTVNRHRWMRRES